MKVHLIFDTTPKAAHRGETELPFVEVMPGVAVQVVHVNIKAGLWVTRLRAQPGVTLQRHKHTGEVFAFTFAGSWNYLEYPEINRAGSYLFKPAGSVHTLHVPSASSCVTDVSFAIRRANLYLDEADNVTSVTNATAALQRYLEARKLAGSESPDVLVE